MPFKNHRAMVTEYLDRSRSYRIMARILNPRAKRVLIGHINNFRRSYVKKLKTPVAVALFITNRCPMRCLFCFYKEKLDTPDELMTLQELACVAKSFKHPPHIILTGGEPFLRDDIGEICALFNRCSGTRHISISTNGLLTGTIERNVRKILDTARLRSLKIQLSLDALGEKHDHLRNVKGAFSHAVDTLTVLKRLQGTYRNLYIEIASLVTTFLINGIREFIEYFRDFQVPIKFSMIRSIDFGLSGLAKEHSSQLFPEADPAFPGLDELGYFFETARGLNDRSRYKFWTPFQQLKFENCLKILDKKKRIFPCYAGSVDAVIYHNGDVAFCENTLPIGNLREHGLDLYSLWRSDRANIFRKTIETCVCINGCNVITSMAYDDEALSKIF